MARNKVDGCMLCDPDPCQCFAPKKVAAPRKRPVEQEPASDRGAEAGEQTEEASPPSRPARPDFKARMKAAAAAAPPPPPVRAAPPPVVKAKAPVKSDDELLLHSALRNLKDLLHPDEMTRWGMVANGRPSQAERAAEWRARRGALQ